MEIISAGCTVSLRQVDKIEALYIIYNKPDASSVHAANKIEQHIKGDAFSKTKKTSHPVSEYSLYCVPVPESLRESPAILWRKLISAACM